MYLVRLMWRSASESKPVHSRYSRLSQARRTAKPIRIILAVSNWFRRRTSHKLNSLNSIRLMWSTASEPGLGYLGNSHDHPHRLLWVSHQLFSDDFLSRTQSSHELNPAVLTPRRTLRQSPLRTAPQNAQSISCSPQTYWPHSLNNGIILHKKITLFPEK